MVRKYPSPVIVVRSIIFNEANEFLLTRRSQRNKGNKGRWEFPGGKLKAGELVEEGLRREIIAETGLQTEPVSKLVYPYSRVIDEGVHQGATHLTLIGLAKLTGGSLKLSREHDDFSWNTYETALEINKLTQATRETLIELGETAFRGIH